MIEPITLSLAIPIAKAVLDKFYEGVGSKLGEKAVELLPKKVQQLGQLVWDKCLRGKPGTDDLLQKAADNSEEAQENLTQYLHEALENDPILKRKAQKLAEEIHQNIQIDDVTGKNVQQVFGGRAEQFNTENVNAPTFQGGSGHNIHITYNNPQPNP